MLRLVEYEISFITSVPGEFIPYILEVCTCTCRSFEKLKQKLTSIRITCPCNEHPLIPHFYIEKLGFTRVYIFFLFLLQNIDCGYSLEPPRYPKSMF